MGDNRHASVALAIKLAKDIGQQDHLDGGNYRAWSETMEALLQDISAGTGNQADTIWNLVVDPAQQDLTPVQVTALTAAQQTRHTCALNFAKQLFKSTVKGINTTLIVSKSPREAWNALQGHHVDQTASNKASLEEKLNDVRLVDFRKKDTTETQAIENYLSTMIDIQTRLQAVGGQVSESSMFMKIRKHLPDSEYQTQKVFLGGYSAQQQTVSSISNYLITQSRDIRSTSRANGRDDALVTTSKGNHNKKRQEHDTRKPFHEGKRDVKGPTFEKQRQFCNKFLLGDCSDGANCPYGRRHLSSIEIKRLFKQQQQQAGNTPQYSAHVTESETEYADDLLVMTHDFDDQFDDPSCLCAVSTPSQHLQQMNLGKSIKIDSPLPHMEHETYMSPDHDQHSAKEEQPKREAAIADFSVAQAYFTQQEVKGQFIVDTGATAHIFRDDDQLITTSNVRPLKNRHVMMNSHKSTVKHLADLKAIPFLDAHNRNTICLDANDALDVPDTRHNIFSVPAWTKQSGGSATFRDKDFDLLDVDNNIVISGVRKGNLYMLPFDYNKNEINLSAGKIVAQPPPIPGLKVLHDRLNHLSLKGIQIMIRRGTVKITDSAQREQILQRTQPIDCDGCAVGKATRTKLPKAESNSSPLDSDPGIFHIDLKGPMVRSRGGSVYAMNVVHAKSGLTWLEFIPTKDTSMTRCQSLFPTIEAETGIKVKILRSDNGGEFGSVEFGKWLKEQGILHQRTSPDSSSQNGMSERRWRTLGENATAMLIQSGLPPSWWPDAYKTSNDVRNRLPSSTRGFVSPFQLVFNKTPRIKHLQPFGCAAFARLPDELRIKSDLSGRARRCLFLGYDNDTKDGYKLLNLETNRVVHSRSVRFLPDVFPSADRTRGVTPISVPHVFPEMESFSNHSQSGQQQANSENAGFVPKASAPQIPVDNNDVYNIPPPLEDIPLVINAPPPFAGRVRAKPAVYDPSAYKAAKLHDRERAALVAITTADRSISDPQNTKEALSSPLKEEWEHAIRNETDALYKNKTFVFVDTLPAGRKAIGCRFVFKTKRGPHGEITKHKARLVAQGFRQRYGFDYDEIFSPTPRWESIRMVFSTAVQRRLALIGGDVDAAYLASILEEEIYLIIPEGFPDTPARSKYMLLKKALYGLKQSGRLWFIHLTNTLKQLGFNSTAADPCLFIKVNGSDTALILFYVDDLVIAAPTHLITGINNALKKVYSIKDGGNLSWFLGCSIDYNQEKGFLSLSQTAYARDILTRANMQDCKPVETPIEVRLVAPDSPVDAEEEQQLKHFDVIKLYPKIVGALLFLVLCSRPDLAYAVNQLTRYMSAPRMTHFTALKRVLRYLKGTTTLGLYYTRSNKADYALVGYSDADWAGDVKTRKSTTGNCFLLSGAAISWRVMTQSCISLSTAEAELVALAKTVQQALWLNRLSHNIGFDFQPITINEDNQAAIILSNDDKFSERTKHMDTRYFFVRDIIKQGVIHLQYTPTTSQAADIFTKPLGKIIFCRLRAMLGMRHIKFN